MSLSKIRAYFNNQIKAVDSDFKPHNDAFNDENLPATSIDKSYHLTYEISSSALGQQMVEQVIGVSIKFYFKGYLDTIVMFDDAMNLVNTISNNAMSKDAIYAFRSTDNYPLQLVEMLSMTPEQFDKNDNSMTVDVEFNANIFYNIC